MIFNDVLEIRNGRNQKNVENPDGKYPIYGSGGIMGYADDYICEADTVIIGRKGNINNAIEAMHDLCDAVKDMDQNHQQQAFWGCLGVMAEEFHWK